MKIIYAFVLLLAMSASLVGQTFINENFSSGTVPPSGWAIDNLATQWSSSATANAGGTAPEAKFTWKQTTATSRLISPIIDLTGHQFVVLRFKHFLDNYGGGQYSIGAATRSGGSDWNIAWEVFPTNNIGPEDRLITIDNDDVGQSDFEFCIYIDGNMYNMDYWYIDDVSLFVPANLDGEMQAITTYPFVNGSTAVEGVVFNKGLTPITSVEVQWQANGGDIFTSNFSGFNIEMGYSYEFSCDDLFDFPIGTYDLQVWLSSVNGTPDDDPDNDSLTKEISVVSHIVDRKPLFEEFTSSTCGPCAGFNSSFVPWCETHADDITLVKYQMDWPSPGDPYYTEERGIRKTYYGISAVPNIVGNGEVFSASMSNVNNFYNEAIELQGFVSFVASRSSVNRSTIMDIDVTILPYANFNDFKLFVIVFEKLTTGNVGNNGETEFEHVMMKMVPDAYGTTINLVDREPVTISQSVDLSGTFIEEYDDLGVVIIIQNIATAEVHQSGYAIENGVFADDAALSELNVDGTLISNFDPAVFDYYIDLPEGTTEIPEVSGLATDPNATVIVVPANELPGNTTIDVYAEDLQTHELYTVNFTVLTGIGDNYSDNIKVYPNPTTGFVNISGAKNANVAIYNITGTLVAEYDNLTKETIDLSAQANGIYIVSISTNSFVTTKRITLNR